MKREQHNYLHIPKTGGTALKYVVQQHNRNPSKTQPKLTVPAAGHTQHLSNMNNVCFAIRHPWERFCSGFWERVNMPKRKELSNTVYKDLKDFGYKDYDGLEIEILKKCKTPDEYLTYIRNGGETGGTRPGLFELTSSITHWLGDLETFKKHESRIKLVFHINNFNRIMKDIYDINMPSDPFMKRSKSIFTNTNANQITASNRIWFENQFRAMDYELIAYIKQRPFYHE